MSTNHKPEIPDGSEAIWDRMSLIPFTQRFDGKKADPKLPDKLREELSALRSPCVGRPGLRRVARARARDVGGRRCGDRGVSRGD
jgi:hypothetical protein